MQCGDVFKFWLMWKQRVRVCGGEVQCGRLNGVFIMAHVETMWGGRECTVWEVECH